MWIKVVPVVIMKGLEIEFEYAVMNTCHSVEGISTKGQLPSPVRVGVGVKVQME